MPPNSLAEPPTTMLELSDETNQHDQDAFIVEISLFEELEEFEEDEANDPLFERIQPPVLH